MTFPINLIYCLVLFGIVWYCLVLFGIVWYCLVLFGIVWYCLVLFGIVWYCLVLFGIVSLFTDIPLEETLNLAVDFIFKQHTVLNMSKKELLDLFRFSVFFES